MKTQLYYILLLTFLAISCKTKNESHNFIKILSVIKGDSTDDYNKGFTLGDYFYYDYLTDSLTLRVVQKRDPFRFITYKGKLNNKVYADSIKNLFSILKTSKSDSLISTIHCYQPDCYCNSYYLVYCDSLGNKFMSSNKIDNDKLSSFIHFYYSLKNLNWNKTIVSEKEIDKTKEVVTTLKGLGVYDSVVKKYVPLPCRQGIELNQLYGEWRTIGDGNNDATLKYWITKIDTNGNWVMDKINRHEIIHKYAGKIKSINNKTNTIIVESEKGEATLEILNLTNTCFEIRHKASKQIWRYDRIKYFDQH